MFFSLKPQRVYADYAAATPLDSEVKKAMLPFEREVFGNPASIHEEGRRAKEAVEKSREAIARLFQVQPDEIIFTSGGTESNNLALLGVLRASAAKHPHLITSKIEHGSVLEVAKLHEHEGGLVSYLPVTHEGRVEKSELERAITPETVLVSLSYVNGEIGSIEKVRSLGRVVKEKKAIQPLYFHTDASQAALYLKLLPNDLNVDLLTIDGSKIHGPKGVGLLFVKRGTPLSPLFRGGLQERGLRAGTENVAGIVGLAKALERAASLRDSETKRLNELKALLLSGIQQGIPDVVVNGGDETVPSVLNLCFPGVDTEFLSVKLDHAGVAVSSASACRSISGSGSSYVIEALPEREGCGSSSLRISLGRETSRRDVEVIIKAVLHHAYS